MTQFIVEGEWTGYTSAQRRIVHREVVDAKRADRLKNLKAIVYTDGTTLLINVYPKLHRGKIDTVNSYGSLIKDAEATGKSRVLVADLP